MTSDDLTIEQSVRLLGRRATEGANQRSLKQWLQTDRSRRLRLGFLQPTGALGLNPARLP